VRSKNEDQITTQTRLLDFLATNLEELAQMDQLVTHVIILCFSMKILSFARLALMDIIKMRHLGFEEADREFAYTHENIKIIACIVQKA
jgi:sigma54-dependent transcription regulator